MTIEELKQVRLSRQHLTDKKDKLTVVQNLNGIQSQFTVNVFYSLKIRCSEKITEDNFGEGLVKNWTVRGTVHTFSKEDLPLFKYDNGLYKSLDFKGYIDHFTREWTLTPERQRYWSEFIIEQVKKGVCEREALKNACTESGMTKDELRSMFDPWGGGIRELCERGFLNYKVTEKKAYEICPPFEPMNRQTAESEMMSRYLKHFAPASIADISYYFKYTQSKVKELLNTLSAEKITIDNLDYFYMDKLRTNYPDIPQCILLSGFDQLMLGYKKENSVFLPKEYLRGIFNLAGIVMPAILINGRVVGKWSRKKGKITFDMFESANAKNKKIISETAEKLFENIKKIEWKGNTL